MKIIVNLAVLAAGIAIIAGIVSRVICQPIAIIPGGLEASGLFAAANTLLLLAIALILLEKKQ